MKQLTLLLTLILTTSGIWAQNPDPTRFANEVDAIKNKEFNIDPKKPVVVFTGSSSVRMWKDVQAYYPQVNAINTGFGGSHFTDLIHYRKPLIFDLKPDKLFIYEGDNDISDNKSPAEVLAAAAYLFAEIRRELPDTKIYFISTKPSIARWKYKEQYEQLNALLAQFCEYDEMTYFVDVWTPMMGADNMVLSDIFLGDNLHMNEKGYAIWGRVIGKFLTPGND